MVLKHIGFQEHYYNCIWVKENYVEVNNNRYMLIRIEYTRMFEDFQIHNFVKSIEHRIAFTFIEVHYIDKFYYRYFLVYGVE